MKVITLTQPWATLVAIGAKRIETRSWHTSYRGPLLIHAAKGLADLGSEHELMLLCRREPFRSALIGAGYLGTPGLPRGKIIAACRLVAILRTENTPIGMRGETAIIDSSGEYRIIEMTDQEIAFGDYTEGRHAWFLDNVRALPEPIPAKGALGLWTWEGELPL